MQFRFYKLGLTVMSLLLSSSFINAQMSGTYSVNGGGAASATNYMTVSDAVSDLMSGTRTDGGPSNGPGVSGPVTIRLAAGSGPYTEQITFGAIAGVSPINTVRLTGGPTMETIDYTNTTTTDRHVIRLFGAQFINIDSLNIVNYGVTYGYGVWITANSDYNVVQNSTITVDNTSTSSNFAGVTISGNTPTTTGDNGDYNLIQNNVVSGGYYGYSCNGTSTTVHSVQNHVIGNEFKDFYYYGIRHYEQNDGIISDNIVHARASGTTSAYGMYIYYNDNFTIERNRIYDVGTYGMYISYGNYQGGAPTTRASVKNNIIGGTSLSTGTTYGIYVTTNARDIDIFHNSISITSGNGRCLYIVSGTGADVRNNSFSIINSTTGYAAYVSSPAYLLNMDYNNYYAPGSSSFIYVGAAYDQLTYQGAAGFNTNSIDGDPNYVNPYNDLHAFAAQLYDMGDPALLASVTDDYDMDPRPNPMSILPDIGADEYLPNNNDITVTMLLEPSDFICPDSNQVVKAIIRNQGLVSATNIPVYSDVTGIVSANLSTVYAGTLALNEQDTVTLGTINTWSGGALNFNTYSALVGDQDLSNDTLNVDIFINLTPASPTINDTMACAGDSLQLICSSTGTNYWYDAPLGGNLLASGDTLNTSMLSGNTSYFIEAKGVASNSLTTTFANNNSCGGGNMFDITALSDILIDSFALNMSSSANVDIYYKVGTHIGSETNAIAWTLLGSATVTSAGTGNPSFCPVGGLTIPSGQTYGIYVATSTIVYTSLGASTVYSSPEMDVTCGTGLCGLFSGTNYPRGWNGTVFYTAEGCPSQRTEVAVQVDQAPAIALVDTINCGPAMLNAGVTADTYMWSNGGTAQTTTINTSGTYTLTATNGICSATDTVDVTINNLPIVSLGADTTICDTTYITLNAGNSGASYVWSTSASTQTIDVSTTGTYDVEVTDGNGCVGTDAITVTVVDCSAGFSDMQSVQFTVYPNPFDDNVSIKLENGFEEQVSIVVYDLNGKSLLSTTRQLQENTPVTLNLSGLNAGMYIIEVTGANFNWNGQLLKN